MGEPVTFTAGEIALIVLGTIIIAGTVAYITYTMIDMPKVKTGGEAGVKDNFRNTKFIIPVVYGKRKIGGNIVYMNSTGSDNKYLHMIIVLAQGECNKIAQVDGVDQVFLDDKLYTDPSFTIPSGGGEQNPGIKVYYEFFSGSAGQNYCTTLNSYDPSWTDNLRDICYIYVRLEYDMRVYQRIPVITVELEGKKLHDPRGSVSGSVTRDNTRLSLVDGTAFAWLNGVDLSPYLNYYLTITDSAGKSVRGWIKAAGTGETLGSELLTNGGFDSDTSSWILYDSAVLASVAGGQDGNCLRITEGGENSPVAYQDISVGMLRGRLFFFTYYVKQGTEATYVAYAWLDPNSVPPSTAYTGESTGSWVQHSVYGIVEGGLRIIVGHLGLAASGSTIYYDTVSVKQVLTPPATGVTIVSGREGTVYNWESIDNGFDYNDPDGYTYAISNMQYSTNAALAARDYMTNIRYGAGVPGNYIDDTSSGSAATYFESKGWAINKIYNDDSYVDDVIADLLKHFRGIRVWDNKYYLRYSDLNAEASVMALSDQVNIIDDSESISMPSRYSNINRAVIKWVDPTRNYVEDELKIMYDPGYVKAGDYRDLTVELLGCTSKEMALQLGTYYLEREILNRRVSIRCLDEAMKLEPHDLVTVTLESFGWTAHLCRVASMEILSNDEVSLELIEENIDLYDDIVNIVPDTVYGLNFPDPNAEPPSVSNVELAEELIAYRERRFTRLKVTFDPPVDYIWFDHIEVWFSDDNDTWKHLFNTTNDFNIDNVLEGQNYWLRLKVVNIWGVKQQDGNDYKTNKIIIGYVDAPTSLAALYAIVSENGINLYAARVLDSDVELYEFRLGGWIGGVFLASMRSPNLSFKGIKPGSFEFYCNTLSNNGKYGDTPRGVSVYIPAPPIGWQIAHFDTDSYSAGTHDNTEQYLYNGEYYVRCSHTGGVLTGTYTSPIFDISSDIPGWLTAVLDVYIDTPILVTGAGTTWDDAIPDPHTWDDIGISTRRWYEIFALTAAPTIGIKILHGPTSPPVNEVEKMEILSAILTGSRYFQVVITITDPSLQVFGMVEHYTINYCTRI